MQPMEGFNNKWSNNQQLWWVNGGPGNKLTLSLPVNDAGSYDVIGFFTRASDYGIFRTTVNGEASSTLVDGYSNTVEPTGPVSFGRFDLKKGTNEVVIEIIGKDFRSAGFGDGYLVGIDGFSLVKK
jgi:arylsulfatase A